MVFLMAYMAFPPVGLCLYERRALAPARRGYSRIRRSIDLCNIVSVNANALDAEGLSNGRDSAGGVARLLGRVGGVEVVLAYEDHGEFLEGREVQGFVKRAF